jgi:7,8-dihydro-6-hydroxymethylpterin-pyrophosphokinase
MIQHFKLIHHKHTAQYRPHEHTSYLPLFILVLFTGTLLAWFSIKAYAATPYDGPEAGSIGLTGTMPGPPPNIAATITSPKNGQHFTNSTVKVVGTCPEGTLVEVFKNNIFAGSALCGSNGTYNVDIDLLFGKNTLTARVYDSLNQAGPLSNSVTVYFDASLLLADPAAALDLSGPQFILQTDAVFRGTFPEKPLNMPITVIGGTAPFAINVEWGDGSNSVIPRADNTTFNTAHTYKKPGNYKVTLQGSDTRKFVAFLTVAAIINGQPEVISSVNTPEIANKLFVLWPVLAIIATAVICFWLGEKREKRKEDKQAQNSTPPFGVSSQPTA